jgi:hypothetical protein
MLTHTRKDLAVLRSTKDEPLMVMFLQIEIQQAVLQIKTPTYSFKTNCKKNLKQENSVV